MSTVTPLPLAQHDRLNDVVTTNLLAELARRRVTQRAAARALGISEQAFSDRVRGRTRTTLDDLQAYSLLLGINPAALLVRPEGLEPPTFCCGAWDRIRAWFGRRRQAAALPAGVIDLEAARAERRAGRRDATEGVSA